MMMKNREELDSMMREAYGHLNRAVDVLTNIKEIADKYPDLPVHEVLEMATEEMRRQYKEKQDAKQG